MWLQTTMVEFSCQYVLIIINLKNIYNLFTSKFEIKVQMPAKDKDNFKRSKDGKDNELEM